MTAYQLPDGNVQISFSGGRTSAYMLHQILEANGGLPDRARVVFANTGREMPETLDFVAEVSERWDVPVVWLEYYDPPGEAVARRDRFAVVTRETASENGEPFEAIIHRKKGTPNTMVRFCTGELKVEIGDRYLQSLGWETWSVGLGIRADEAHRCKPMHKDIKSAWYPLVAAGVSRHDVAAFWGRQPFDLRLPLVNGRSPLGNCDGCFLKSEASLAALARDYPERFQWWVDMEAKVTEIRGRKQSFRAHKSYRELGEFVDAQGDWVFDVDGVLCQADGGECTG